MRTRIVVIVGALLAVAGLEFGLLGAQGFGWAGGIANLPPVASALKQKPTPTPGLGPGEPASIQLTADPLTIHCDGNEHTALTVVLTDVTGKPVSDGTFVRFSAYNGSTTPQDTQTNKGVASTSVVFYGDTFPSGPNVIVDAGLLEAGIRVWCVPDSNPTPVSPPPCIPSPGSGPLSPPCATPPPCPLSPPAVSPACGTPTPTPCPLSPPSVSPPCGTPTPPSPPTCEPTSPPSLSAPCASQTPTPVPCGTPTSPPCSGSGFAVALDCDIAVAGIQSDCTLAPGTSSLDVAVVFANDADLATTLASFNFNLHDSDTSRLNPPPGTDDNLDANPDFNQADLTTSWYCGAPAPTNDTGLDGPGRADSFLSCYTGSTTPPVTVDAGGRINLAIVHYAVPANATDGTVQLTLSDVAVANFNTVTLVNCGTASPACRPATIVISSSGTGGPPTPTPTPGAAG